jgi:hypothetical protein
MRFGSRVSVSRATPIAGAVIACTMWAATPAIAAAGGPPQSTPASGTPQLALTSSVQQVRQLVQCGSTMYAVGTFSTITQASTTYTRNGAFSFQASSPFTVTNWNPNVNGTVNSIAFNGGDCSTAYLGGKFSTVGGTSAKNLAAVSTATGAVISSFTHSANGQVETMLVRNGHVLTGGYFTSISGSSAHPYFASLNATTGKDDGYLDLHISGNYVYTDDSGQQSAENPTRVYNQQLSNGGSRLLVEGDFTTIGGQPRRQIAMLDLGSSAATVDSWYATEFNGNCAVSLPFYARDASWSPDDQTVYVASTGYKPANGPGFRTTDPRAGMCDSAAAFPSSAGTVTHKWINYTGCDALLSSAADRSTAYFAGHERWASNPRQCDNNDSGQAVSAPGFVGLSPTSGAVTFNPTRSRGSGADDMLVTGAGLWIASDTQDNSQSCGHQSGHAGICFLPY